MKIYCQWYAMCTNEAIGVSSMPALGPVPVCERCTTKHDLPVVRGTFDVTRGGDDTEVTFVPA